MTDINPSPSWAAVRQLEIGEFALGGANGNMNEQARALAARSEFLKQRAAYQYNTLAEANADIANIAVNQNVNVVDSGLYYKEIAGATSLTKSPYDPLGQSKTYTDSQIPVKDLVRQVSLTGDVLLSNAQMDRRILAFTGTLTADATITVPNINGYWLFRNSTVGGFSLKLKGVSQGGNVLVPASREIFAEQNAGFLLYVGQPFVSGNLQDFTANTKPAADNSTAVATTAHVQSAITDREKITLITLTDADQTISSSSIQTNIVLLSGTLTANRTITIQNTNREQIFANGTTGGFSVSLKGVGQSQLLAIPNGSKVSAYVANGYFQQVRATPLADSFLEGAPRANSPTIEDDSTRIATTEHVKDFREDRQSTTSIAITGNTTLLLAQTVRDTLAFTGALSSNAVVTFPNISAARIVRNLTNRDIEIRGSSQSVGIVITPYNRAYLLFVGGNAEIVSTSVSSANSSMSYVGKHKWGDSYAAGQVFDHGSGKYLTLSNVNTLYSPINNSSVVKIGYNPLSGPERKLTTLSATKSAATSHQSPRFITKDGRVTLDATGNQIRASLDFGVTWESGYLFQAPTGHATEWVTQTKDGELLVCAYATAAVTGTFSIRKIYKSTGYLGGTVAPTWTLVKETDRNGITFVQWGLSDYKNYMFLAEYGAKTGVYYSESLPNGAPAGQYARYVYMSKDYGMTWQVVFDLNTVTDGIGVHLHGVAYDPWWNRIWVGHGDGAFGTNGLYYSDNFGKTWTSATQFNNAGSNFSQSVYIIPMPTCILFGSDSYPNGVQRIDRAAGRIPTKGYYDIEAAWMVPDQQASLNQLCQSVAYTPWLPDSPVLFGFGAETKAGKSCVVATFNGWDFYNVWVDDVNSTSGFGVRAVTGVTYENEVKILVSDPNRVDFAPWMLVTAKVDID